LAQWNETSTDYEREAGIAELFERQVEARPEAIAVVYEDEQVSYGELNERANQLAHYLRRLGVGPEVLVGVMLERSVEMIVALLAVVKAGGAYLPLDPSYPLERLAFMLEDGQPAVLLTETKQLEQLPAFWGQVLCMEDRGEWAGESKANPARYEGAAEQLAYVSYTSGSTGQPKGVMAPQRGVVRLVRGADYAEFGSEEVYLQYAPITFDASTFEIWGSLLHGARLVVMKAGTATLGELAATVQREQVSVLWLTAGLFQQMVESEGEALVGVRQLLAGGDVLPVRQVREHLQQRRSGKLINGYGPTESTTFACTQALEQLEELTTVPIGRPIENSQV
jgi:aspartate racemase